MNDTLTLLLDAWREDIDTVPLPDFSHLTAATALEDALR